MKKIIIIVVVTSSIAIQVEASTHMFSAFVGGIYHELCKFGIEDDAREYAEGSWEIADDFIIDFFNSLPKDKTPLEYLSNFDNGYIVNASYDERLKRAMLGFQIVLPLDETVVEHNFRFTIYRMPGIDASFLVFYDQSLWHMTGINKKLIFSDRESVTNFRIIRFVPAKNSYRIVTKFEESNFINTIVFNDKFKASTRKDIPLHSWSGGLDAGSLEQSENKAINFPQLATFRPR